MVQTKLLDNLYHLCTLRTELNQQLTSHKMSQPQQLVQNSLCQRTYSDKRDKPQFLTKMKDKRLYVDSFYRGACAETLHLAADS